MEVNEIDLPELSGLILEKLQEEDRPIPQSKLHKMIKEEIGKGISARRMSIELKNLRDRGYDIKTITGRKEQAHVLVRYADEKEEEMYRPLADIKTPIYLAGDFHIGHESFSSQAFDAMLDDIDNYIKPHDIMIPGDICQGLGVYEVELKDLKEPNIDAQLEMCADYLSQVPSSINMHAIIGNHEQKLKGKHRVGFDPVQNLATRVENLHYYKSVGEFKLNKKFRYLMVHGGGGQSYAKSYPLQKLWRGLPSPRPDILHVGHYHVLQPVPIPPNKLLVCSGTFQKESSYGIWRGMQQHVGYAILNKFTQTGFDLRIRTPKTY